MDWQDAPVTFDLDFHDRLFAFLILTGGREAVELAYELTRHMGIAARKSLANQLTERNCSGIVGPTNDKGDRHDDRIEGSVP